MSFSSRTRKSVRVCALLFCCSSSVVIAFPPAPPFIVAGVVRDAYGWPIEDEEEGEILLQSGGQTVGIGLIRRSAVPGQNFSLAVPLDQSSTDDPYRPDAGRIRAPYSLVVRIGESLFGVTKVVVSASDEIEPGGRLLVDLTIGEDADGDLIPDEWEYWQLIIGGIFPGNEDYNLDYFGDGDSDADGVSDYVEYVTGTFAFLATDRLYLKVLESTADGWARFETFQIAGKSYLIEQSNDMVEWRLSTVTLDGDRNIAYNGWLADRDQVRSIEIHAPDGGNTNFRLVIY